MPELSPSDIGILRKIIRDVRARRQNVQSRSQEDPIQYSPEVYIAQAGSTIAPLTITEDDEEGNSQPDTVQSASCKIFKVKFNADSDDELIDAGFSRNVYNLGGCPIANDYYFPVERDKFGRWIAVPLPMRCLMLFGKTTAAVASTDSSFTVNNVVACDDSLTAPVSGTSDTFVVNNWAKWTAKSGVVCMFLVKSLTAIDSSVGTGEFVQGGCIGDS
jgi:hypothetical protein